MRGNKSHYDSLKVRKPYTLRADLPPNGHWLFPEQMNASGKCVGFVYAIRNRLNGMMYIGRKFYTDRGPKTKGLETDWKTYTTSNRDVDKLARVLMAKGVPVGELFDMHVLEEYKTVGALTFAETWCLVTAETPCKKQFYNTLIGGISWPVKEPITPRNRQRLQSFLDGTL